MACWNQIRRIRDFVTHLDGHYNGKGTMNLPIKIRDQFSQWIEDYPWNRLNEENVESFGKEFIGQFINKLKNTQFSVPSEIQAINEYCAQLAGFYDNPSNFIKVLNDGLKLERDYLNTLRQSAYENSRHLNNGRYQQIDNIINDFKLRCKHSENLYDNIVHHQEQSTIDCQRLNEIDEFIKSQGIQAQLHLNKQKLEKKDLEKNLQDNYANILATYEVLSATIAENFSQIENFHSNNLSNELKEWQRCQQLAGNGASMENGNLDQLQIWYEALVDCILTECRTISRALHLLNNQYDQLRMHFDSLNEQYTRLLIKITQSTFIIEKQPPQVMKTNTRFTGTVRLLVGVKTSLHLYPPVVEVSIVSEAQACNLVRNRDNLTDSNLKDCAGEIINNRGPMEFNSISSHLSLNLRNMQLKKIRRTEKKGTESVMDEKFSLLFLTKFKIGELFYRAWALSLPVVAVVHGNQEPHAWATVTWDNAFAERDRLPFVIPDKVLWSRVGDVLSTKFKNSISKGLSKENLRFLAGKVFRNTNLGEYDQIGLSWSLFSKEAIPDQSFTFWEWFYALFKMTKDHLAKLWQDELITFITKKKAEELLIDRPPGTFLIRFSDSELGGVSICFRDNEKISPYSIVHIQPFTSNDLKIKSMADRVHDIKQLTHLYPDIHKDAVFGKYYTQSQGSELQSNGYVKPELVTRIRLKPINGAVGYNDANKSNEFPMHEYSMHRFGSLTSAHDSSALSDGALSNGNFEFKFSTSNSTNDSVPNDSDLRASSQDLNNFLPSINDEDLIHFDIKEEYSSAEF